MPTEFVSLPPSKQAGALRIEYAWCTPDGVAKTAPLMVFLHEGLGSLSMWRDFPTQLCESLGCQGLVYSRPGYGQSTPRAANEQWGCDFMHQQAQEVLPALLQALGIAPQKTPVWLFGHSDGGSIALLAAAHMKTIQGVVVLAPHIFVEDISVASIAETRAAYLNPNTQLKQRLGRHHVDVDSAFWGWNNIWLQPEFRHWRIDHELSDIDCPVLAIQGRDDEYGTLAQIEGIAQILSQCECLVLDHCGHSPHKDQPQALTASVKTFFKQHQPPIFGDQHETP